jgi:hypothetical protein
MGDRYGKARLEAACARAIGIGNPTRKNVEAILKSGLDKVTVPSDVETKKVIHDNIRGGEYFDRKETATSDEEIETRYLAEERLAIINDSSEQRSTGSTSGSAQMERSGVSSDGVVASGLAVNEPSSKMLMALIDRLKTLWSRPMAAKSGSLRTACEDNVFPSEQGEDPQCTSSSECLPTRQIAKWDEPV